MLTLETRRADALRVGISAKRTVQHAINLRVNRADLPPMPTLTERLTLAAWRLQSRRTNEMELGFMFKISLYGLVDCNHPSRYFAVGWELDCLACCFSSSRRRKWLAFQPISSPVGV